MSKFDTELKALLSAEDEAFIEDHIEEKGFYAEVLGSLKGKGSAMHLFTWAGIMVFGFGLIFCLWKFFQADTTRDQIMFAMLAILLNSAQIALKIMVQYAPKPPRNPARDQPPASGRRAGGVITTTNPSRRQPKAGPQDEGLSLVV